MLCESFCEPAHPGLHLCGLSRTIPTAFATASLTVRIPAECQNQLVMFLGSLHIVASAGHNVQGLSLFLSPLKGFLAVFAQEGHHPDDRPLTLACHAAEDPDTGRMTIRMRVLKPLTTVDKNVVAAAVAASSGKPMVVNSEQQSRPACLKQPPADSSCSCNLPQDRKQGLQSLAAAPWISKRAPAWLLQGHGHCRFCPPVICHTDQHRWPM